MWRLKVGTGWTDNLVYRAEKIDALVHDAAGDSDGDWDLDMHDFRVLQLAFTGSGAPGLGFPDTLVDHDADGDVDATDAELFGRWATGPAR